MTTFFFKSAHSDQIFYWFTVLMAHAAASTPKIPEKRNATFHNTNKTYFKTDLKKIATSLNKDIFFPINVFWPFLLQIHSSNRPFSCFHTKNPGKLHYFTKPIRHNFKTDNRENSTQYQRDKKIKDVIANLPTTSLDWRTDATDCNSCSTMLEQKHSIPLLYFWEGL